MRLCVPRQFLHFLSVSHTNKVLIPTLLPSHSKESFLLAVGPFFLSPSPLSPCQIIIIIHSVLVSLQPLLSSLLPMLARDHGPHQLFKMPPHQANQSSSQKQESYPHYLECRGLGRADWTEAGWKQPMLTGLRPDSQQLFTFRYCTVHDNIILLSCCRGIKCFIFISFSHSDRNQSGISTE